MNVSSFPEMYERWLVGPLFRPWAEIVLERDTEGLSFDIGANVATAHG